MTVKITRDLITPHIKGIKKQLKIMPKEAHKVFVGATPIRRGNARRNTKLNNNVIRADYNYAYLLEKGRSKQAPKGMTEPTFNFLKKFLDKVFRR
jgi:hypothetical protein